MPGQDYTTLDRPYDPNTLTRSADLAVASNGSDIQDSGASTAPTDINADASGAGSGLTPATGGAAQQATVPAAGALTDIWIQNFIKSANWSPKKTGFYLDGQRGYAEFTSVYVSGPIVAVSGTIGGWTINATTLVGGNTTLDSAGVITLGTANDVVVLSSVDALYRIWVGNALAASAPFSVTKAGAVAASNITITGGSITGVPISGIPNSTATDISLLEATHGLVFSVTDKDTVAWGSGTITLSNGRTFSISAGNTGDMAARTYIYLDTGVSSTVLQTTTTVSTAIGANKKLIAVAQNGSAQSQFTVYGGIGGIKLPSSGTSISNNNWAYSGTWSVTDLDTIAWGAGTLTTSDGGSYSISGSNTGNMAAKTYIYFDLGVSSTAFQTTTTAATSIGDGKVLIAIAQNGTAEANFMVVNDKQLNIDAANIVAGSVTANEIAAGAITSTKINVSQLSAISADMGAITAGTIVVPSGGFMRSGQTAYNTGTGFYIGNDSGTPKFSIGNSAGNKLTWDGTILAVSGQLLAGSIDIPDTATANSFHTDSSGNSWWGATTLASAAASVTSAGVGTFIGLTSLNKKVYTNFEAIGRFVTTGGDVLPVFNTAGMTIAPSATSGHFCRTLWYISHVYTNNPLFQVALIAGALSAASGSARTFIGLGAPTVSGTGISYTGIDHIGFTINKDSGVVNVGGQNGDSGGSTGANFTTIVDDDDLELFLKVTSTSVKYYYRKNGGTLTLGTTQTTNIPTAVGEIYASFMTSNATTAFNFILQLQSAGYEH